MQNLKLFCNQSLPFCRFNLHGREHSCPLCTVLYSHANFAGLIFAVRQSTAKTTKIGPLEDFQYAVYVPSSLYCRPLESEEVQGESGYPLPTKLANAPPHTHTRKHNKNVYIPSSLCCRPLESRNSLDPLASQIWTFFSPSFFPLVHPAINQSSSSATPRQNTRLVVSSGNWSRRLNLYI